MTVTDKVSIDKKTTGAKAVSGLSPLVIDNKFITNTTRPM